MEWSERRRWGEGWIGGWRRWRGRREAGGAERWRGWGGVDVECIVNARPQGALLYYLCGSGTFHLFKKTSPIIEERVLKELK